MRIWFALVTIAFTLFVLAACGGDEDGDDANSDATPPAAEVAAELTESTPQPDVPTATAEPVPTPTPTPEPQESVETPNPEPAEPSPTPEPEVEEPPQQMELPDSVFLENMTQIYQTWNNCSAASACMLLSHYGIQADQEAVRPEVRPNDDAKHGKAERLIDYFHSQEFRATLMHGGDVETLKAFLANDIPVIVQQWLDLDGDPIGHYRVVRGYDDQQQIFRINDSMHGGDVHYSYEHFYASWRAFSYRFMPVYPPEKDDVVAQILGDEMDRQVNRERTANRIAAELDERPDDAELWFSLGTNYYDLGLYEEAIQAYEHARNLGLPPKMLWYVYWPAAAYNQAGRHERAIEIATAQLESAGTFGDMRYERARAWEALGQIDRAVNEYRAALEDDPMMSEPREALRRLGAL